MKRIAVLPSMVTLGNAFAGFGSIYYSMMALQVPEPVGDYYLYACWLIFAGMVFDMLDGSVARMVNMVTEFGGQLDSLCDAVSFGMAPAILTLSYLTNLHHSPIRFRWLLPACFLVCTILRLARFNVESLKSSSKKGFFKGLPSPAGAAVITGLILGFLTYNQTIIEWVPNAERLFGAIMLMMCVVIGALEVSNVPYIHLGFVLFRERKPFTFVVELLFFAVLVALSGPQIMLLTGLLSYVVIGLILHIRRKLLAGTSPKKALSQQEKG